MTAFNYALAAADLRAEFNAGRWSIPEYQTRIKALNRRYAKQARKAKKVSPKA